MARKEQGLTVIDDGNFQEHVTAIANGTFSAGWTERDYAAKPFTTSYSLPIIRDRKELKERAIEANAKKATPGHIHTHYKLPILNQNGYGYCWCYGTVGAGMTSYACQGGFVPQLSATSLAAKIKNYDDEGGWAKEALDGWEKFGCGELSLWPEHQVDRRYDTPELRANAALHHVEKYEELPQNDFEALCTYILAGIPCTMGVMWWGHLIYGVRVVVLKNGELGIEIVNSWGDDWETGGKAILAESKATAQEQIAIMSMTARRKAA